MRTSYLLGVCAVVALQPSVMAQASWTQLATAGPSARQSHAMAYDSQRGRAVLFGGYDNGYLSDTWEWTGSTWLQVGNSGPSGRQAPSLVYDSQRGRSVLFGGTDINGYLADTWEWDGSGWLLVATTGPGVRAGQAMAYDNVRGRTVLFGGYGGSSYRADTWEWNGATWLPQVFASGPVGRAAHAMAFDSHNGVTVLFGGQGSNGNLGDTWAWNGITWIMLANSGPSPRTEHSMSYDSLRGRTVLFGGSTFLGDTWEWNGSTWIQQVLPSGPLPRIRHAMAYDEDRGLTVLFGGWRNQPLGDTWARRGTGVAIAYGDGCGSPTLSLSPVVGAQPNINSVAQAHLSGVPSLLAFVAIGWSRNAFGPFSLPLTLTGYGMPGCDLLQSSEFVVPVAMTGPGVGSYTLILPNWSALIGLQLYLQGWASAPGSNSGNAIVSNGLEWVIGN